MKLLFCLKCKDLFRLTDTKKQCECKSIGGKYVDEINAVYWGEEAMPIGFANYSFVQALHNQPDENGMGERFEAFVIPKECDTFKKVSREIEDEN